MEHYQVLTEKTILFSWLNFDVTQTDTILFDNSLAVKEYENSVIRERIEEFDLKLGRNSMANTNSNKL